MELKDFVKKTINDVIEGVKAAKDDNQDVVASLRVSANQKTDKVIKFKVALTTEESKEAGAKVSVFSVANVGAEGKSLESSLSEVSFQVPIDFQAI